MDHQGIQGELDSTYEACVRTQIPKPDGGRGKGIDATHLFDQWIKDECIRSRQTTCGSADYDRFGIKQ